MAAVNEAVMELAEFGVDVLSPADPRVVDQIGEFVFVASDRVRSVKMVEDRHLECIGASDFLWLVAPDGYVGQSASMELGYAIARGIPIFCRVKPTDGTLEKYVRQVSSISAALPLAYAAHRPALVHNSTLIDPLSAIELAHDRLDFLRGRLAGPTSRIRDAEGAPVLSALRDMAPLMAPSGASRDDLT
jgi:nucleoside 2-deoxyribosyltransferase